MISYMTMAAGFVMNKAMLKRYAPFLLKGNAPTGNPDYKGTGILMDMGVGDVTYFGHMAGKTVAARSLKPYDLN